MIYESTGTIRVYPRGSVARYGGAANKSGVIQIDACWGIVLYYTYWVKKEYNLDKLNWPRQGSHVTIVDENVHKGVNLEKAKHWNGKKVKFYYDSNVVEGGRKGVFRNFYLPVVECDAIDKIKKELGVIDSPKFIGCHLTIGNTKNI